MPGNVLSIFEHIFSSDPIIQCIDGIKHQMMKDEKLVVSHHSNEGQIQNTDPGLSNFRYLLGLLVALNL